MNRFLIFAVLALVTSLHFSCTAVESAENILGQGGSSSSFLPGSILPCRSAGGCAEISPEACIAFGGTVVASCQAGSPQNGSVPCRSASGCAEMPPEACSAFGGTIVASCPVGNSSSSLQNGSVFCRSAGGCAEMPSEACSAFGGTVVAYCLDNPSPSSSGITPSSSSVVIVIVSSSSAGGGVVGGTGGPVSRYGELKRSGNKLVGSKTGSAVQVRGVSLFWSNTGWGGDRFFNATTVNAMVDDWKAEIIRVPIGYSESGGYKSDPSNLTRVKAAIDAAIAKDVYVIIDWHSHNAHNETSAATTFFTQMAETYGSYNNVIFEIYNEPLDIQWGEIKTYANTIISAIRQHSDNLILVGTPNWDQDVDAAASSQVSDANVAYVFHFYAYTHPLSSFQSKINAVLSAGYPVFVSEYGTTHADGGNPDEGNYNTHSANNANAWHTFMDNNQISSCAWSINDKYEGSAFFGTGTTFDMSSWTNTSKMTASGQYIYNKLKSPPSSGGTQSSSSGGGGTGLYCDFGPGHSGGKGGCYEFTGECDLEWGELVSSCGKTGRMFCVYKPYLDDPGGCWYEPSQYYCEDNYGTWVSRCPGFSYPGVD